MKNLRLVLLLTITTMLSFSFSSCDKENDIDEIHDEKIVKDLDGNIYNTVTIGSQTWMVENLKTTKYSNGEPIDNVVDVTKWRELNSGAYCDYDNKKENSEIYGRLYNWYAVNDSRKIAPVGWRIPNRNDWEILEGFLIEKGFNYDGTVSDNKIAKSLSSTTRWATLDEDGAVGYSQILNNSSGFTALPAGCRLVLGTYNLIGFSSYFWSSTDVSLDKAYNRFMFYNSKSFLEYSQYKTCGFSVRCIKE